MVKICKKCNLDKDCIDFSKNSIYCKLCSSIYKKNYYKQNIKKYRAYLNNRRAERVKWLQELKNKPCKDCNKFYEPYCMDFDHIKLDKINSISRMVLNNTPKSKILEEIEKCELVCVLCHNIRTNKRFFEKLGQNRKYKSSQIRNIKIINEFKNKPCIICGNLYESFNMQTDHKFNKSYNVCDLKNYKLETLKNELIKCQVLCALCHRRKSIKEQKDNFGNNK